jgi:integrase
MASMEAKIARAKKEIAAGKKPKAVITGDHGLRILVRGKSVTSFFRGERGGKVYEVPFGALVLIGLEQATKQAKQCRIWLREGKDPREEFGAKKEAAAKVRAEGSRTVRQVGDEWYGHLRTVKKYGLPFSQSYLRDIARVLRDDIYPYIGDMPIQEVDRSVILTKTKIKWLWYNKRYRPWRLQQTLNQIFDWAQDHGYYTGRNPAVYDEQLKKILPEGVFAREKHASLPDAQLPAFMAMLRGFRYRATYTKKMNLAADHRLPVLLMAEFVILNGCRVREARLAQWKEIDWKNEIWWVPRTHLKNARFWPAFWSDAGKESEEFKLPRPLTPEMLAILKEIKGRSNPDPEAPIFRPLGSPGKPGGRLINETSINCCWKNTFPWEGNWDKKRRRRERAEDRSPNPNQSPFALHGFRTNFEDWRKKNEAKFPPVWSEYQTDHPPKGTRNKAYFKDLLVDERRKMMGAWCKYLARPAPREKEKPLPVRSCQHCGDPIPVDKPSHTKWCSVACRSAAGREARYDRVLASNREYYDRNKEKILAQKAAAWRARKPRSIPVERRT